MCPSTWSSYPTVVSGRHKGKVNSLTQLFYLGASLPFQIHTTSLCDRKINRYNCFGGAEGIFCDVPLSNLCYLVGMVVLGWWLDLTILEVSSNIWIYDSMILLRYIHLKLRERNAKTKSLTLLTFYVGYFYILNFYYILSTPYPNLKIRQFENS